MMEKFDPPFLRCPLCASQRIAHHLTDSDGIAIFRCRDCRIQFMNPQYSQAYLADYYSHYTIEEPEWDEPLRYGHTFYLTLIEKHCSSPGRLLDIGSGKGHLLAMAKRRGWSPVGYEIDCGVAQQVGARLGVEIVCGPFVGVGWSEKSFDVVSMHHVIEHLKSPLPYLDTIRSILRDGGILFLVLPNIHSRSALWKFFLEKAGVRKKNIGAYYDTGHHLWYYTPRSLRVLLERYGFRVLEMRSGHPVRPGQSALKRFWLRNFSDRIVWKSTFLVIARKTQKADVISV